MPRRYVALLLLAVTMWAVRAHTPFSALSRTGSAAAQDSSRDQRKSGGQAAGAAMIVQNEAVQRELKLTDAQRNAIRDLPAQVHKKFEKDLEAIRNLQDKDKRDRQREIRARFAAEFPRALAEVLNSEQQKRLKQLQLQYSGGLAFRESDVINRLRLSEDQRLEIDKHVYQSQEETVEAYRKHGDTKPAHQRALEIRADLFKHVEAALKDEQRIAWRDMIGPSFEFPPKPPSALEERAIATPVERPGLAHGSREWIDERVNAWQPTDAERRVFQIGWAESIEQAKQLALAHQRPVFLFNYSGNIRKGRC